MLLRAQTCENRLLALRPIRLVFHHLGSEVAVTDGLQFRPRGYESLADDFDVRPGFIGTDLSWHQLFTVELQAIHFAVFHELK
jgi:hypothetical protein